VRRAGGLDTTAVDLRTHLQRRRVRARVRRRRRVEEYFGAVHATVVRGVVTGGPRECDSSIQRSRRFVMWQQGQVFKLKAKSIDGAPRAVPLQAKALEALDRLPPPRSSLLFANSRGGYIDFRSFGRRHWKPAQAKAGIEPLRHLYDLRHTYATFALSAGVSVFAVSRFMDSSIAMIDRHYGHLARDSCEHAVSLLDALAVERAVDAGWTSRPRPAKPLTIGNPRPRSTRSRRAVDARWTPGRPTVVPFANKRSKRSARLGCQLRAGMGSPRAWAVMTSVR